MLQSDMCILKSLSPEVRYNMGECRNDKGGYFIVDGKEKVIISKKNLLTIRFTFKRKRRMYIVFLQIYDLYQKMPQNQ